MKLLSAILASLITLPALATTIAIIDSGVDYKSDAFHMWMNPNEVEDHRDNDGNGYQDDIYGWNFAEDNPEIIDYSFLGTFPEGVYKFFEIQGKIFLGEETEADRKWLEEARGNKELISHLQVFGNFVHGTHVAGIASGGDNNINIMGLKLLPTKASPFFEKARSQSLMGEGKGNPESDGFRTRLLKSLLSQLAAAQSVLMQNVGYYLAEKKVDVANGSFGSNYAQIAPIIEIGFKAVFWRAPKATGEKPEESELHPFLMHFMQENLKGSEELVKYSPNTLFVFAAGNNGTNNDIYPTSPANIKRDNVITVGATYSYDFFAPFSNYGALVDVAAPGMLITSAIPGGEELQVSGTSQAAPFVAHVAAQIKDLNPSLRPVDIKKIIMETADKKDYLKGKISTSGIVNVRRAIWTAKFSRKNSLDEAIRKGNESVAEMAGTGRKPPQRAQAQIMPLPMTPQYTK